jgi:replicative DNA helicase
VELKRISRDYNTPVLAISSFNRENYASPVNMAAFKESGAVEYTSDVLIGLQYMGMDYMEGEKAAAREERIRLLYKDNKQKAKKGQAVQIQLKILKNRSGGLADMGFYYYPMFNHYVAAN